MPNRRSQFTVNEASVCNFVINRNSYDAAAVRNANLHGRDYLVVPMVMITRGVHAGNRGPLYYADDDLGKTPAVWNSKPVVVSHPKNAAGEHILAGTPHTMEQYQIGMVMNTHYDKAAGKLRAEAWLDRSLLTKYPQIEQAITNNQALPVSTGLWTDDVEEAGTFNGANYTARATNFRPEHLAVLLGEPPADPAAGLLKNSAAGASGAGDVDTIVSAVTTAVVNELGPLVRNAMNREQQIARLVKAGWAQAEANALTDGGLKLVCNSLDAEAAAKAEAEKAKKEATQPATPPAAPPAVPAPATGETAPAGSTNPTTTNSAQPRPMTDAECLAAMSPALRNMLQAGLSAFTANRAAQVQAVLAVPGNAFSADQLNAMDQATLNTLHQSFTANAAQTNPLAGLVPPGLPLNLFGVSGAPAVPPPPTVNYAAAGGAAGTLNSAGGQTPPVAGLKLPSTWEPTPAK